MRVHCMKPFPFCFSRFPLQIARQQNRKLVSADWLDKTLKITSMSCNVGTTNVVENAKYYILVYKLNIVCKPQLLLHFQLQQFHQYNFRTDPLYVNYLLNFMAFPPSSGMHMHYWLLCSTFKLTSVYSEYILCSRPETSPYNVTTYCKSQLNLHTAMVRT
jgi:hypothetical protein